MHTSTTSSAIEPATAPEIGQLVVSTRHEYLGYGFNKSHCRARVYTRGEAIIVVISEQPDNPGTSVTNAIEQIASEMLADLVAMDPTRRDAITWIEHYPAALDSLPIAESFDVVTFAHFMPASARTKREPVGSLRGPRWRRITREELESLIGMAWE